jgi:hypothetical protein
MAIAAIADEVGVRIVSGAGPGALTTSDGEPLLGQVRAREVFREVRRSEDERAVSEREHCRESLAPRRS